MVERPAGRSMLVRYAAEDATIVTPLDPWDAIDILEGHAHELGFGPRWRAFLRAVALLLLPRLPADAADWFAAADDYEQGQMTERALDRVRERAWRFHDGRRDSSPVAELSGLRAVMYRLWPSGVDVRHWSEEASHFLDFCNEAGLAKDQWLSLLKTAFADILDGGPAAA